MDAHCAQPVSRDGGCFGIAVILSCPAIEAMGTVDKHTSALDRRTLREGVGMPDFLGVNLLDRHSCLAAIEPRRVAARTGAASAAVGVERWSSGGGAVEKHRQRQAHSVSRVSGAAWKQRLRSAVSQPLQKSRAQLSAAHRKSRPHFTFSRPFFRLIFADRVCSEAARRRGGGAA